MARAAGLVASTVILLLSGCATPGPGVHPVAAPGLRIAAAGDTHTYRWDGGEPGPVGAIIAQQDLFLFNAEGVFSDRLTRADCREFAHQSTFLGPARPLARLPRAPVTVASLANNHAMDCGPAGLLQSLGALHAHGIRTVGAGADLRAACEPLVLSVRGWTVAVLAYAELSPLILNYIGMEPDFPFAGPNKPGAASWSACDGPRRVAEMKSRADVVIVQAHTHHWAQGYGSSWSEQPSPQAVSFLQEILTAGADLVFGSGPHLPQAVLRDERGLAFLSLGNFHFRQDEGLPPEARRAILARASVSPARIDLELVPLALDDLGQPREMAPAQRREFIDYLSRQSSRLGTNLDFQNRPGHLSFARIPH